MERLDPELEQLLEKARPAEEPTAQDRDRNRGALARRIGTAALVGVAAVTTSDVAAGVVGGATGASVKAGASGAALLALKIGAPLVLIGAVGTVALPRIMGRTALPAHEAVAPAGAPAERFQHRADETAPTEPLPVAPPAPAPSPTPAPVAQAPSAAKGPALSEEVALLQRAERALREGKPEQAMAALAEHARQFPKGELRAERTAARIAALCALHRRDEARRDATAFLRQWPSSPLAAQVRASCAAPDDKAKLP